MRLTGSFFNLLAIGKKGAIIEPGDAELSVPAVWTQGNELPSPLSFVDTTAPNTYSHNNQIQRLQPGVDAGGNTDGFPIAAGVWRLHGYVSIQFTGTVNAASQVSAGITPSAASGAEILASAFLLSTPLNLFYRYDFIVHLIKDGWLFRITGPATIAGDQLAVQHRVMCSRLL